MAGYTAQLVRTLQNGCCNLLFRHVDLHKKAHRSTCSGVLRFQNSVAPVDPYCKSPIRPPLPHFLRVSRFLSSPRLRVSAVKSLPDLRSSAQICGKRISPMSAMSCDGARSRRSKQHFFLLFNCPIDRCCDDCWKSPLQVRTTSS